MRAFFGLGQASHPASQKPAQDSAEVKAEQLFADAQVALNKLRVHTSQGEETVLLNSAQRCIHELEALVRSGSLTADLQLVWRSQVEELQRELEFAVNKMAPPPPTRPAGQQRAPPPAPQHPPAPQAHPTAAALDVGGTEDDLFSGLDLNLGAGPSTAVATSRSQAAPPAAAGEVVGPLARGGSSPEPDALVGGDLPGRSTQTAATADSSVVALHRDASNSASPAMAALDEDLFSSLASEPEPAIAVAAAAPPATEAQAAAAAALNQPPTAIHGSGSTGASVAYAEPIPGMAAALPAAGGDLLPPVEGRVRKKVIRSRIGYARAATPAGRVEPADAGSLVAALAGASAPPSMAQQIAPAAAPLEGQACDAGSIRSAASVGSVPSIAAEGANSRPGSRGGQLGHGSREGSAAAETLAALDASESIGVRQVEGQATGGNSDPQHLTALQQHVAQLDIRLELPERPTPAQPAHSNDSHRSTVAVKGLPGGADSDSDESITSPEFRPAEELGLPKPSAAVGQASAGGTQPAAAAVTFGGSSTVGAGQQHPATQELSFVDQLAAVERGRDARAVQLAQQLAELAQQEQRAKQQRRQAAADSAALSARIAELQRGEEQAVEAEDYEKAAALSTDQEAAKAELEQVLSKLQAADAVQRGASEKRLLLVQEQAAVWEGAAAALRSLQEAQQRHKASAEAHAAQVAAAAAKAEEAAIHGIQELQQQSEELRQSITARQVQMEQQQGEQKRQLQEQRQQVAAVHAALEAEVEELRAALAAKEAQLAGSKQQLEEADAAIASLPDRFAELAAAIQADQRQLDNCQLEAEGEAASLEQARQEAALEQQAAAAAMTEAAQQLEQMTAAAAAAAAEAGKLRAQADLAGRAAQKMAELRQAEEEVRRQVVEAETAAAEVQGRLRELAAQRARLQHEVGLAEAAAAAARARVPELEATKKAAAAARDFKAAAEAAAEAKAAAVEAAAAEERAVALKEQAAAAGAEERELQQQAGEADAAVAAATTAAAKAQWRGLLGAHAELQKQLVRPGDEGTDDVALRAELDTLTAEAAVLAAAHGFAAEDAADVAAAVSESAEMALGSQSAQAPPLPATALAEAPPSSDAAAAPAQAGADIIPATEAAAAAPVMAEGDDASSHAPVASGAHPPMAQGPAAAAVFEVAEEGAGTSGGPAGGAPEVAGGEQQAAEGEGVSPVDSAGPPATAAEGGELSQGAEGAQVEGSGTPDLAVTSGEAAEAGVEGAAEVSTPSADAHGAAGEEGVEKLFGGLNLSS